MWDFKWRRKRKTPEPLCFHKWRLLDMWVVDIYEFAQNEPMYEIACTVCGKRRTFDRSGYSTFKETFNVEEEKIREDIKDANYQT